MGISSATNTNWGRWNQYKMVSHYREEINVTVTIVGSTGILNNEDQLGLVLLDDIVITITKNVKETDSLTDPRLVPEADLNKEGSWTKIETEAKKEAQNEENDANKGRPTFCSLLPEIGPCSLEKKRYFYNASSKACEKFLYGGCKGNENRFYDLKGCEEICKDKKLVEPIKSRAKIKAVEDFEDGFDDWVARGWRQLRYDSDTARALGVGPPPKDQSSKNNINQIGVTPEDHKFGFRKPNMVEEFQTAPHSELKIDFHLIVKGMQNSGFLSFFLDTNPGFNIYVGSIKVYDFNQLGINDEQWHAYRLIINETEVQKHLKESGNEFLLITIKGWLGSNVKGAVVLDNLNVTFVQEMEHEEISSMNITTEHSSHPGCLFQPEKGNCSSQVTRWYYSMPADACKQFTWSGCGGNENNHKTQKECIEKCTDVTVNAKAQKSPPQPVDKSRDLGKEMANWKKSSPPTVFNESVCGLSPDKGSCKGNKQRYYYNAQEEMCKEFYWSGCGGNDNNFVSEHECFKACHPGEEDFQLHHGPFRPDSGEENDPDYDYFIDYDDNDFSHYLFPLLIDNSPSVICNHQYDEGPCFQKDPTKYLHRWFYNKATGACDNFFYGGCGGNHNNFNNKSDCEAFCGVKKSSEVPQSFNKSSCLVSPRLGTCHLHLQRGFFSHWDNICKPYNYSGCGGNNNNFPSEESCRRNCPPMVIPHTATRCQKIRVRGECSSRTKRYFFDQIERKCVKFGGCSDVGLEENNFPTRQQCSDICIGKRNVTNSADSTKEAATSASAATTAVEVLLSITLIGLTGFATFLGWKHYRARQGVETYHHFINHSSGPVGGNTDTVASYNNPAYQSQLLDQINRRESCVEIPALTLENLGSKAVVFGNTESFA